MILLRIVCYGALAVFAASWIALEIIGWLGVCPQGEAIAVTCANDVATWVRSTSMTTLITGVFLGIPFLLGGLAFLAYDLFHLISRWTGRGSNSGRD